MLEIGNSIFVLVDVQGRLAQLMHEKESLFANLQRLISGMQALGIPRVWVEQNPARMGETIPELKSLLPQERPIPKMSFSCCGEPAFMAALSRLGRRQILIAGIETHVCVFQTASDLVSGGYEAHVAADAVSSRTQENKQLGLDRIRTAGARLTSVESALFELLRTAEHPAFKEILKLVR